VIVVCCQVERGLCEGLITCPEEFLSSSVYPMNVIPKPLRVGHDPESDRRARGEGKGEAFCYVRLADNVKT